MTKQDKERIKLLEKQRLVLLISLIFVGGLLIYYVETSFDFKQQVQSCQKEVPDWTVESYCVENVEGVNMNIRSYVNFTDERSYQEFLDFHRKNLPKNCEIVK